MYDCWEQKHKATSGTCPVTSALPYLKSNLKCIGVISAAIPFRVPPLYNTLTSSSSLPECPLLPESLKWTPVHFPQPSFIISHTSFLKLSSCITANLLRHYTCYLWFLQSSWNEISSYHLIIRSSTSTLLQAATLFLFHAAVTRLWAWTKAHKAKKHVTLSLKETLTAVILNFYATRRIMALLKLEVQSGTSHCHLKYGDTL